jgi:hypothetical protein
VPNGMPIVQAAIARAVSSLGDSLAIPTLASGVQTVGLGAIRKMQLRTGLLLHPSGSSWRISGPAL